MEDDPKVSAAAAGVTTYFITRFHFSNIQSRDVLIKSNEIN
jgi:hypothetical protein